MNVIQAQNLWQRAQPIVDSFLETEDKLWPKLLAARCGEDVELFLEVSTLLAASRKLGDFIERPALDVLGIR